jgi:PAS domain S-box-containing protein
LVFLIDLDTVLISTNDKFAERMGMKADTMVGTILSRLFPEDIYRARKVYFDQVISSGNPITFVDENNGTWFDNRFYPIKDVSGKVVRVAIFAQDITERRRMTEALRASEEQYRTLAEAAHDMIFTITRDGRIGYVNSFGANFLGLEPRQLIGQPRERLFRSEINPQQEDHIQNVFKTGQAISSENAIKFSNRTIWFNTWLVPLRGSAGEISSILGVSRDITERRKSLEALQQAREQLEERVAERTKELLASQEKLRLLATQTVNAQEKERRSISRELHDEAGQALITLKYDLASIQNELPETDALLRQRLSESMKIIDQTMLHIRDLAHSLRPPVLEVGGIHLSLQDYCQEISGRTHIPISYQGLDIPGIPDETGISLYRFVQEALTNIMKHAHATKVKVRLHYNKGEISLSVSDNGRGMGEPDRSEGLGLLGIKERLNLLGGKLEIHSQKGRGTKLVAHVPWVSSGIE